MDIADVANYFNQMPCHDGYTGQYLFDGQLGLYDDVRNDTVVSERRVLSLEPGVQIPTRRVIECNGVRFILGHRNADSFQGVTIRDGFVVHESPELAQIRTLGQVCRDEPGFTAYAGNAWVRNLAWVDQTSLLVPQQHLHFATTESGVVEDRVILYGPRLYVVRTEHLGPGGTLVATCDEMLEPVIQIGSIVNTTYDPLDETATGISVPVRVVRVRWQSMFKYRNNMAPKFSSEDIQVAIAKSAMTVKSGARLTLPDGQWFIASVLSENDVWLCRAVQHG